MTTTAISGVQQAAPQQAAVKPAQKAEDSTFSSEFEKATNETAQKSDPKQNAAQDATQKPETGKAEGEKQDVARMEEPQEEAIATEAMPAIAMAMMQGMQEALQMEAEPQQDATQLAAEPVPVQVMQEMELPVQSNTEEPAMQPAEEPVAQVFVRQVMQEMERSLAGEAAQPQEAGLESEAQIAKVITTQNADEAQTGNEQTPADAKKESAPAAQTPTLTETVFAAAAQERPAAPAAPEAALEVQPVREAFIGRIVEQVQSAVSADRSELFIQLRPEHLGGLSIALTMTDKGLTAKLATSSHEVQSMLNSEMASLQAALREKGVNVVQMEVVYDQMGNMAGRDFAQSGGGGRWSGQGQNGGRGNSAAATIDIMELAAEYSALLEPESSLQFNA